MDIGGIGNNDFLERLNREIHRRARVVAVSRTSSR